MGTRRLQQVPEHQRTHPVLQSGAGCGGGIQSGSLTDQLGSSPRFAVDRIRNWRLGSRGHSANPTLRTPAGSRRTAGDRTDFFPRRRRAPLVTKRPRRSLWTTRPMMTVGSQGESGEASAQEGSRLAGAKLWPYSVCSSRTVG